VEPGSQLNFQNILEQAQRMQEQILAAQEAMAEAEVHGSAGAGLVEVTANGQGEITDLVIDPKVIDASDPAETAETVAALVLAAIRDASRAAQELMQEKLGPLAEGPGGLGGLGGEGGLPGFPGLPGLSG
jgi:DNA-binding YbaB/EbfC family protein